MVLKKSFSQKEKVSSNKKSLKSILSLFWENHSFFERPAQEKAFVDELKNDMNKASGSYKSMMEIHGLLVSVYKKLIKK